MPQRQFLIASSLARLIRTAQGGAGRIVEGHFPAHARRTHFVSIGPERCFLVLGARHDNGIEECTEVPRSQAEALFTVCEGKVGFECTPVRLRGDHEAVLRHFIAPGSLDLLGVEFADGDQAEGFIPPVWFGPEVTQNAVYDRGSLARVGAPTPETIPLSNEMLNELLDTLEESALAAQLEIIPVERVPDSGSAPRRTEAASSEPDRFPAARVENTGDEGLPDAPAQAIGESHATNSATPKGPAVSAVQRRDRERVFFGLPARKLR